MKIHHKQFYFMRHGETDWNRRRIYMGSQDIPLNQLGIEQAELAAQYLKDEPISHIVTSPLSRAPKTAEIIASVLEKPVTIIDEFIECCWGIKEGRPYDGGETLGL